VVAVVAMAAIVMLSAPLKDFLQYRADRFFYGERYDLRNSLLDFGKTLSATTQIDLLSKRFGQPFTAGSGRRKSRRFY
jgi:hypothetical protein